MAKKDKKNKKQSKKKEAKKERKKKYQLAKNKKVVKKDKKKWVIIVSPKEFRNAIIGETHTSDPNKSINKIMSTNMMTLTGDPKKQNIIIYFKIISIKEGKLQTETIGFDTSKPYLKRIYKRAKAKVEYSFVTKTKEGKEVRIKPVIISKAKATNSILTAIQKTSKESLIKALESRDFSDTMISILKGELPHQVKVESKKIFPITSVLIKSIKIIK